MGEGGRLRSSCCRFAIWLCMKEYAKKDTGTDAKELPFYSRRNKYHLKLLDHGNIIIGYDVKTCVCVCLHLQDVRLNGVNLRLSLHRAAMEPSHDQNYKYKYRYNQ
jgi:hypothetical protein